MFKFSLIILLAALMTGCAHKTCNLTDWAALGADYASRGRAPELPADLVQQCRSQGAEPDIALFKKSHEEGMLNRCSAKTAFFVGSMSTVGTFNDCKFCGSKEAVNACWEARISAGMINSTQKAIEDIEMSLRYFQNALDDCKTRLAVAKKNPEQYSEAAQSAMAKNCDILESYMDVVKQNHIDQKRRSIAYQYGECQKKYAETAPELAQYCGEQAKGALKNMSEGGIFDLPNGKRMMNFSQ